MRYIFCAIPAFLVFGICWTLGVLLVGAGPKQAFYSAVLFGAAMFVLGWQVTCPKRERLRDAAAQKAQA